MTRTTGPLGCTYFNCRHRSAALRLDCRARLRNLRLKELDTLESLIREERAQLLADKFRAMDLLPGESPAENAGDSY